MSRAAPTDGASDSVWRGFLLKKRPRGLVKKAWQRRFFVLQKDVLSWYRKNTSEAPRGSIILTTIMAIKEPDVGDVKALKRHGGAARFDIDVPNGDTSRTFSLVAESAEQRRTICNALRNLAAAAREQEQEGADRQADWQTRIAKSGEKYWKATEAIEKRRISLSRMHTHDRTKLDRHRSGSSVAPGTISRAPSGTSSIDVTQFSRVSIAAIAEEEDSPASPRGDGFTMVSRVSGTESHGVVRIKRAATGRMYLLHIVPGGSLEAEQMALAASVSSTLFPGIVPPLLTSLDYNDANGSQGVIAPAWCVYAQPSQRSIFQCLRDGTVHRAPMPILPHVATQVVASMAAAHAAGVPLNGLCLEHLYIDGNARVVMCDPWLCMGRRARDGHVAMEYATPEELRALTLRGKEQEETSANIHDDWWRLGVLLYELAVGIPPWRSAASSTDRAQDLLDQVSAYAADEATLRFPPFVSESLESLIRALLAVAADARLGAHPDGARAVLAHAFFTDKKEDASAESWLAEHLTPPPFCGTGREHVEHTVVSVKVLAGRHPGISEEDARFLFAAVSCHAGEYKIRTLPRGAASSSKVPAAVFSMGKRESGDPDVEVDLQVRLYRGSADHPPSALLDEVVGVMSCPVASLMAVRRRAGWFSLLGEDGLVRGELRLLLHVTVHPLGVSWEDQRRACRVHYGADLRALVASIQLRREQVRID